MNRSLKILLVGVGLIISGFVMEEIFDYIPFSTNPQVNEKIIQPGSEHHFQINSKGTTKMSGLFTSTPKDVTIKVEIKNTKGDIIWDGESKTVHANTSEEKQVIVSDFFNPDSKGSIDVSITNLGNEPVIVNGGLHDAVDATQYESELEGLADIYSEMLVYILMSELLKFVGIILGVISAIFFFKDWKKSREIKIE